MLPALPALLPLLALACSDPPAPSGAPAPGAPAPASTPVTVALNWYPEPEFGGFYQALLDGTYARAGLEVTILPGGPGAPVLEQLAAGKVQVAISGADDLLLRRAKGLDAVAIYAGFQDSPTGIMVHADGAASFDALTGRVAIEQGSPFQLFLAQKYGWAGSGGRPKVEMVPTGGGVGAFIADPALSQQGYITSEPCQVEAAGARARFLPARDAGWNPYASLAVVRGADAAAPWAAAFRDASRAGWASYLADPAKADAEIMRLNPALTAPMLACIGRQQRPYVEGADHRADLALGRMDAARWDQVAATLNSVVPPDQQVVAAGAWR